MSKVRETVEFLRKQIDECDDLIVEISQLRYRLDAILNEIDRGPDKPVLKKCHERRNSKSIA
jgi:uncharacterized coiled-coil DUF342 family protein